MFNLKKIYGIQAAGGLLLLLVVIFLTASIFLHHGGYAHPEIENYLPHYLSDKPLLNIIYDSNITDNGAYQARELSYLVDYIDSKFIEFSIYLGFPHFLAISHYIFCGLITFVLWQFGKKDLGVHPILVILLIGIFLSSPSIFLGGVYFRSAKIGFALVTLLTLRLIFLTVRSSYKNPDYQPSTVTLIILFFLCFLGALFDRQGFYFQTIYLVIVVLWLIFFYEKRLLTLIYAIGLGIIFSSLYNHYLAPWITYALNGYHPDFTYQKISIKGFFPHVFEYIYQGAKLYLQTFGNVFGGIHPYILFIISGALTLKAIFFIKKNHSVKNKLIIYFIYLSCVYSALVILIFSFMVFKHPPLTWPDVSKVYYWIPTATIFIMAILFYTSASNPLYLSNFALLFTIIFALNLINIPSNIDQLENGHLKVAIAEGPVLLADIKHISDKKYNPAMESRRNKIYQFILKKYQN